MEHMELGKSFLRRIRNGFLHRIQAKVEKANGCAVHQGPSTVLISVLMPVYNTDHDVLQMAIDSVLNQVYENWELCVVDDASTDREIRAILRSYAKKDSRIRIKFSRKNQGIAKSINKAAKMSRGEFIGVLDHDDELAPNALEEFQHLIEMRPDADLVYCDEDKIDNNGYYCYPWHKSHWNPDLSLSFNYVMHFALYRRTVFEEVGGVARAYEGSQDYDLLLRVSEKTDKIYHIPKVLYHWRMGDASIAGGPEAKPGVFISGLAALNDALKRRGIEGVGVDAPNAWKGVYRVKRVIDRSIFCSIIILYYGDTEAMSRLMKSIKTFVPESSAEILICKTNSARTDKTEIEKLFPFVSGWVEPEGLASAPRAYNEASKRARGDLLFFLDETMELSGENSFWGLVEQAQRKEVGAVGGKVYYKNGLVEHAGVIFGPYSILGYAHRATSDTPGYAGLKNMITNYSAVMGLGMMTRRALFQEKGGFDEGFAQDYWDADYCLKLVESGLLITYTPYARLTHHVRVKAIGELVSEPEATLFKAKWEDVIQSDPYFNPNFTRSLEDFTVDNCLVGINICKGRIKEKLYSIQR